MARKSIAIETEHDIVRARSAGRDLAREGGFGLADQTRLATAISELTRNVIQYAGTGTCALLSEDLGGRVRIEVVVEDHGPGISDVEQAMLDGFTTGRGLGAGLPGTRRLVHDFLIESVPGHTKITIAMTGRA
ncbi:anti-sigma regulatory factor [Planctomycetota bacterium]